VIVGGAVIGLIALTIWLAIVGTSSIGTAKIVGYQHYGDERGIVVFVGVGALTDLAERSVEADAKTVKVTVHVVRPSGSFPAYLIYLPVAIPLHDGLRDRRVLDQDGVEVRDLGVFAPPFPTPRPP
jgi:hypothetical protein